MALLSITDVSHADSPEKLVRGFCLNSPKPGELAQSFALTLVGWAVGREMPASRIEVSDRGETLWWLPINSVRAELAELYEDAPWAEESGFYHVVSALKLPRNFELDLTVVMHDDSRAQIGTIRGTRAPLPELPARFKPVIVLTLGRTGSTWTAALLGQHPDIVAFRPLDYEPKLLRYWTDVFSILSEPASYRESLAADLDAEHWWMGVNRSSPPPPQFDGAIEQWLGEQHVSDLASICKARIDAFYGQVAALQGKEPAGWFVEKASPSGQHERIWPDLYPEAREVFLVRDFRDVACSMLAINRARGFGRKDAQSDEEFIRETFAIHVRQLAKCWNARRSGAHLLHYEDVIAQPSSTLRSLFAFLGLEAGDGVIAAALEQARALAPNLQEVHRTSESVASSIGRWRRDLTASNLAACEESFGDALEVFGYPVSDGRPTPEDGRASLKSNRNDRAGRATDA